MNQASKLPAPLKRVSHLKGKSESFQSKPIAKPLNRPQSRGEIPECDSASAGLFTDASNNHESEI